MYIYIHATCWGSEGHQSDIRTSFFFTLSSICSCSCQNAIEKRKTVSEGAAARRPYHFHFLSSDTRCCITSFFFSPVKRKYVEKTNWGKKGRNRELQKRLRLCGEKEKERERKRERELHHFEERKITEQEEKDEHANTRSERLTGKGGATTVTINLNSTATAAYWQR